MVVAILSWSRRSWRGSHNDRHWRFVVRRSEQLAHLNERKIRAGEQLTATVAINSSLDRFWRVRLFAV